MGRPRKNPVADRVEVYSDEAGEYRWRAIAENGKIVAESGEGYKNRMYARRIAKALNAGAQVEFVG